MKLKTVKYNYSDIIIDKSQEKKDFRKDILLTNIIYLFYKDNECLYVGETGASLDDRCYKNTPKHSEQPWFKEANIIHIIKLGGEIDNIARQALESSFILAYRPKYNKKG